jgi:putative transposase
MPRSNRYLVAGYIYHLTHRCHNREFLLKRVRERDVYRKWLREGVRRFNVSLYAYSVTHNHVHVIAHADDLESLTGMMHLASGSTAKQYNLRTGHLGSLWEHPFQCTLIEGRQHLMNCLSYVDLNMVRAGAVKHPAQWRWCGYDELTGRRPRYRLLNTGRLMQTLGYNSLEEFKPVYDELIRSKIESDDLKRAPCWTEALAVGSREFINKAQMLYPHRHCLYPEEVDSSSADAWCVREEFSS